VSDPTRPKKHQTKYHYQSLYYQQHRNNVPHYSPPARPLLQTLPPLLHPYNPLLRRAAALPPQSRPNNSIQHPELVLRRLQRPIARPPTAMVPLLRTHRNILSIPRRRLYRVLITYPLPRRRPTHYYLGDDLNIHYGNVPLRDLSRCGHDEYSEVDAGRDVWRVWGYL